MSEKTFEAQILTPNGPLFDGEVTSITVPGSEGSFEVLHNHAPLVSTLGIGKVEVVKPDNSEVVYAVSGGFVEVSDNKLTLLAEDATEAKEINVDEIKKQRDEIKKQLEETTHGREELEIEIAKRENLIRVGI